MAYTSNITCDASHTARVRNVLASARAAKVIEREALYLKIEYKFGLGVRENISAVVKLIPSH